MGLLNSGATFSSVVLGIVSLINLLLGVLAALAIVVFFWGLVQYVYKSGDAKAHVEGRERITWSLIALFVLFSIWGILELMQIAFFGGTANTPATVSPSYNIPSNQNTGSGSFGGSSNNAIY